MECSTYVLRIKTKNGQKTINLLSTDNVGTLKEKIAELSQISCNRLNILGGYPPKPLDLTDSTKSMSQIGVKNGDTLIANEKHPDECTPSVSIEADTLLAQQFDDLEMGATVNGLLMTQTVPSDNSCLFTSIGFVLKGIVDTSCHHGMREIIAKRVASDKESYNEAILGKPNDEYCAWIQRPETWGGSIEVSILSSHYGIEIDVVDVRSGVISRFGEDKDFTSRVFLLYDGIHYDALYLESATDPVRTVFDVSDEAVAVRAQQIAAEARSSRQFTDVNRFSLKCMQCNILLIGQAEAQQHAKTTGHTNFGEV
ncbi:ubiquitin thioesterase OTU1-like [Bradysia coprophila]|uniref:ubiquitin thioesterase OTU1-like n=1 Tax=Bradysia coprophila TaxID=38358 RepID=UPI00187D7B38|nr:ubiquitin thioesterase OTU1-like [Bradysia coprophila]